MRGTVTERLHVLITVEQMKKLRKTAYDRHVSQAQVVRDAIDAYGVFKIDSDMLAGDADDKRS